MFVPPNEAPTNQDPKISMDMAILAPPDMNSATLTGPIGDPLSKFAGRSNGPGHNGGIGDGCCGGIGTGDGPGVGPGPGAPRFRQPTFTAGSTGLVNPQAIYRPEPDYSDDARKAKLQGTVVLEVVVDQNGKPQIRKVMQSLGLGLDEQAIKAVSTWRFKAGTKDGKPVPVLINVLVTFRLL